MQKVLYGWGKGKRRRSRAERFQYFGDTPKNPELVENSSCWSPRAVEGTFGALVEISYKIIVITFYVYYFLLREGGTLEEEKKCRERSGAKVKSSSSSSFRSYWFHSDLTWDFIFGRSFLLISRFIHTKHTRETEMTSFGGGVWNGVMYTMYDCCRSGGLVWFLFDFCGLFEMVIWLYVLQS